MQQIRENLERIQEEKKENQEKSGEKEKNIDSIKLTKSFVTLEEKKKLLSEKKGKNVIIYVKVMNKFLYERNGVQNKLN